MDFKDQATHFLDVEISNRKDVSRQEPSFQNSCDSGTKESGVAVLCWPRWHWK